MFRWERPLGRDVEQLRTAEIVGKMKLRWLLYRIARPELRPKQRSVVEVHKQCAPFCDRALPKPHQWSSVELVGPMRIGSRFALVSAIRLQWPAALTMGR